MLQEQNLPKKFKEYFQRNPPFENIANIRLFIFRGDGIVLYSNREDGEKAAIGALMGGAWQAAGALRALVPEIINEKIFRLSFDTSSSGMYICPFQLNQREYYLSLIYSDLANPGKIKFQMRNLIRHLVQYVLEVSNEFPSQSHGRLLFEGITDSEIDALFSFAGN